MKKRNTLALLVLGILSFTLAEAKEERDDITLFDKLRSECVDKNIGKSCYELGIILAEGDEDDRPDFYEAVKYFKLGCKKKYGKSCYRMGQCYQIGKALPKSKLSTKKFYEKACNNGYEKACKKRPLKTI